MWDAARSAVGSRRSFCNSHSGKMRARASERRIWRAGGLGSSRMAPAGANCAARRAAKVAPTPSPKTMILRGEMWRVSVRYVQAAMESSVARRSVGWDPALRPKPR